jgi:uncharacterized peroxidase-related enzyme
MRGICVPADSRTYLPGVEADPKPGVYRDLIEAARARGGEYAHIWDLFAFQHDVTVHLARLSEGIIRRPSTISVGMRELIAAYTSHANECAFCTKAHAAAAGELLGHELVQAVLADVETSPLSDKDKGLLRFVGKVTIDLPAVTGADTDALRAAGWDDEAIYFAISTCALFNFYNRWITASGVPEMSAESHAAQGRNIARNGYIRE